MSNGAVNPVVSLRDLTRVHGSGEAEVRALVGVSLDVAAGELVAVMGPSGSGKTTLLALVGGLDTPTAGNVVVEGVHMSELSRRETAKLRRTSIGYVFQDYNLIPALTAAENVALPLELDGMRAPAERADSRRRRSRRSASPGSARASRRRCPAASVSAPRSPAR